MVVTMGKTRFTIEKLHKLYACKIKHFPLKRNKRNIIYGNPKILESRKIDLEE